MAKRNVTKPRYEKVLVLAGTYEEYTEFRDAHEGDGNDYKFITNRQLISNTGLVLDAVLTGSWFLREDYLFISEILRESGGTIIEA